MVATQTEYFWFEQTSVVIFLAVEKCKPSEIYRRMYDVYREACFSQNI